MIKELLFFCSIAGADYGTSRSVINSGGRELNPVLKNGTTQLAFHSAKCVAQSLIASKVNPKKRKKIYVIAGIVGGGFVVNNVIQMRKQ